jgi:putative secretion ATPase (PEP-CTERM system associated)
VYERFYRLSGIPFQLTPDSRFFFSSSGHARAIAHLVYGLTQQEGFIVITGEVGAGKTTLVEHLWSQIDRNAYVVARVVTTQVSNDDLLRLIMTSFGLETQNADKATLLTRFEALTREHHAYGRRCLLVVDEVQNLSLAALEELRMLSNINVDGRASVQTILLGQPQFRIALARPDTEQLRQRILASYHLEALSEDETRAYVEHRLRTVGWIDDPHFEHDALSAIYDLSGGIPRRINTLCTRVLLLGALEEVHAITSEMVESTALELQQDLGAGLPAAARQVAPVAPMAAVPDATLATVLRRLQALEQGAARQERVFHRLIDMLSAYLEPQR